MAVRRVVPHKAIEKPAGPDIHEGIRPEMLESVKPLPKGVSAVLPNLVIPSSVRDVRDAFGIKDREPKVTHHRDGSETHSYGIREKAEFNLTTFMKRLFPGQKRLDAIELGCDTGWFIENIGKILGKAFDLKMTGTEILTGGVPNDKALRRFGKKSMDFVAVNAPDRWGIHSMLHDAGKFVKDDGVIYFTHSAAQELNMAMWLLSEGYYVMQVPLDVFTNRPLESNYDRCGKALFVSRSPLPGFGYMSKLKVYHVGDPGLKEELAESVIP